MLDINSVEYRQAALAINYDLEALFRKNMLFFQKQDECLYRSATAYKLKRLSLRLDVKGYINLVNMDTNSPVYPCDPSVYAQNQVDKFFIDRPNITISTAMPSEKRDDYPYTKFLHEYKELYLEVKPTKFPKPQGVSDALFMFGGGLYLQLQFLLNKLDVKNLTILETDFDAFYCSMHVIDWSEIYRYFDRPDYSLNIMFMKTNDENFEDISSHILNKGLHNFSKIDFYYHYKNPELDYVAQNIKAYCVWTVGRLGFFEDERIGLVHTIKNIYNSAGKLPLKKPTKSVGEKAVLIIGNGPSLDGLITFIKTNIDRFVVISCGSSIGALMKHGIEPDIHLEQERMSVTKTALLTATTEEYRNKLRFIGLSPCYPDVFDMFKRSYIAPKSNDLGVELIKQSGGKQVHVLENCNPLVSNFGLSIAIDLGFKNIYLAGVDCGMVDVNHHHSKSSNLYYNDSGETTQTYSKEATVKGNFRQTVYTTDLFKSSKKSLEAKISSVRNINVFNLSDGAFINGTTPLKVDDACQLDVKQVKNKDEFIDRLLEQFFAKNVVSNNALDEAVKKFQEEASNFFKEIRPFFNVLLMNEIELKQNFNKVEALLFHVYKHNMALYRLFNGSLRGVMLNVMHDRKVLSDDVYAQYIPKIQEKINTFLDEVEVELTTGFYKYDVS